jgi:ribosomal protein S18 acetylase RimI-like enzyme
MNHLQSMGPLALASMLKNLCDNLIIRDYSSEYFEAFKEINYQWLNESVGISTYDEKVLNNPEEEIIKKGGKIYLAFAGTELAGTFILLKLSKNDIELTKLAVKKPYRRMGIGEMLTKYAIQEAKNIGCHTILLLTHPSLSEAINLYRKLGFTEIPGHPDFPDPTGRCSITMQYIINH